MASSVWEQRVGYFWSSGGGYQDDLKSWFISTSKEESGETVRVNSAERKALGCFSFDDYEYSGVGLWFADFAWLGVFMAQLMDE